MILARLRFATMAFAVATTVYIAPSLLDPFNLPKLTLLLMAAGFVLALAPWFWVHARSKEMLIPSALVGVFLVGLSAAAVAGDQAWYRTLFGAWARNNGWLAYASLALLMWAVMLAFRGQQTRLVLYTVAGLGVFESFYGVLQHTGHDPIPWNNGYNPIIGTLGNPNFASAFLGIAAVAQLWIALERSHSKDLRAAALGAAAVAVWLTIASDSIQGTLAFGAGAATLLAVWLGDDARRPALRRLLLPYLGLGAVGAVIGVLGLMNTGPLASILYSQNLVNRTYYWRAAVAMFERNPLFGIGLDSFGEWYRVVRIPEQVAATGVQTSSNAAHNVFLHLLATGGLVLLVPYVLLLAFVAWRAVVAIRSSGTRLTAGALLAAWVAFQLQAFFSIDQLGLTVWGWVLSGALVAVSFVDDRVKPRTAKNPTPVVVGVGGALVAVLVVVPTWLQERELKNALVTPFDKANATQVAAVRDLVTAAIVDAKDPYWSARGVNALFGLGAADEAIAQAEAAAKRFPLDITLWNQIAVGYEQTGRAPQAVAARQRTLDLDPLNEEYRRLLAADRAAK